MPSVSIPAPRADLLVAGAGAAGMMAALVAAHRGASVLLLERDPGGPSNLMVSGGLFPGAGTRYQAQAGIADDPERFAGDAHAKAGGAVDPPVLAAIAAQSAPAVHFLADIAGLPIKLLAGLPVPGHSAPRLHATPAESGRELHALLRAAVDACARIHRVDEAEAIELLTEPDPSPATGAPTIRGLKALVCGQSRDFAAPAVLLATGGFAANQALLAEYLPEMKGALHIGAGANDGRAVRLGRALDADVGFMQGYQGQGHVNPPEGRTRLGMSLPPLGAFLVNRDGRRFVAEDIGPSELAAFVLAQPGGVALEVFDARIHASASTQGPYREAFEAGKIQIAQSPADLAHRFNIPLLPFEETFARFSAAVASGHDPEWGRKRFGPALVAPLYAAWVTGALAHTQGGLRVDANARVLRRNGSVIEGLYAAGGAAASISGVGGAGYLPGNGLAQSFGLAMLAAQHVTGRPGKAP
jgi:fumarate reductase flavoprotein subunit